TLLGRESVATSGLLDSGAAVNVLPYSLGVQLGFDWDQQTRAVELSGNLAAVEARGVVVSAAVEGFPPVRLAFAWPKTNSVSLIPTGFGSDRPAWSIRPPERSPAVPRQRGLPMAVVLKLKKILREAFPPPDKVNLRDEDGIIGVVTSKRFRRMDSMQRQDLIH